MVCISTIKFLYRNIKIPICIKLQKKLIKIFIGVHLTRQVITRASSDLGILKNIIIFIIFYKRVGLV